jgi:D-alanyl-D-alanine carboxypeptidase/D-alanyl-D-alanine-endopeptidase (penicillin-binding protein 4)
MPFRCFAIALVVCASALAGAAELPAPVRQAFGAAGIPLDHVAVVVRAADGGAELVRHNDRQAMNPASVMKLVTTYAALDLLGPAYTWKTEALADAPPVAGHLAGNLYLRGSGDPRLALEQFWLLLRQLRARGVADIEGDLVLDRSAFVLPPHSPAAFDNEPLRPYNAGPDALLVNLNSVRLTLQADRAQGGVTVISETPSEALRVVNRLRLVDEPCDDWREKLKISVDADAIELAGSFAASCGEKALHLSPWPADVQVERLFRALWRELGGSLRGTLRSAATPASAATIAIAESPPLADVIREINKYSNNVMARQLFLTLAADRPATPEGARRRVEAWLSEKGLAQPGLVLDNGSGLSRSERISAGMLGRLLLAAWTSPVMPELVASLPLAGIDGTLRKRFTDDAASGRAHLKTGYLEGVRSLAGYVLDRNNRYWIVVVLVNDPKARLGRPAIDALLRWVAER